jgi:capsular polysaccharide biosynthesis protein
MVATREDKRIYLMTTNDISRKTQFFNYNNTFKGKLPDWCNSELPTIDVGFRTVPNAFVTKGSLEGWPRSLISGVFDNDLNEVPESAFVRGYRVSFPRDLTQIELKGLNIKKGQSVYLGWLITHYGHFITESISRMWWLVKYRDEIKNCVFLVHANFKNPNDFPLHVKETLQALGVSLSQIVLIDEDMICESLIVPSQSIVLDYSISESQLATWNRIKAQLIKIPAIEPKRKIYLSRKYQDQKDSSRKFNDSEVEALFERFGFEIVYPEQLSFKEQISIYADTKILAGPVGSAMHNAAFMNENGTVLILAPNSFLFKTDAHISKVKKHTLYYFLHDSGSTNIKRVNYEINIEELSDFLAKELHSFIDE